MDKENDLGMHSSGRNSGVLHAGSYYKPNTLRAKVCIEGSRRLKEWCEEQSIDFLKCGKVITPQKQSFDDQIDLLYDRGKANGADVNIINEVEFNKLVPDGRTASVFRVIAMIITGVLAMITFIKSFINARKKKS